MNLNTKQKQAVEYTKGPLLIVAGAGTGKTTVITEKIKYLLNRGIGPQEVLALTFTEKAANQMVERLDTVMPYGYEEPWVHTFHTFCSRVLKAEALEIGLDPNFKILTGPQQWLLIKEHLFEFELKYYRPLGNPNKFIGAMVTYFSRLQDEDVSTNDLMSFVESKKQKAISKIKVPAAYSDMDKEEVDKLSEMARAYQKYQALKIQESALDFGDLITKTLELFRSRKTVLTKYQDQFKHVLVDEFQDTNFAQYQLVKLLVPPGKKTPLTVVGDDSQSIYRFRGAAISNILNFMEDYQEAKQVVLVENYRSYQIILDGAYKLIKNNDPETLEAKLGISKNLISKKRTINNKQKRERAVIVECLGESDEVEMVVKKIYELLAEKKYTYKDFAVIARSNAQLEPFLSAFKQLSLPYRRVGNRGLLDQDEVVTLIHFLETVANSNDAAAVFGLLQYEPLGIAPVKMLEMLSRAKRERVALWQVVKENEEASRLVEWVEAAQAEAVKQRPSKLLLDFINTSEYLKPLVEKESIENQLKIKNLNLFFSYIRKLESVKKDYLVVELVEEIHDLMEARDNPSQAEVEDVDAITLSTVHSAKGLEFGTVFMVSLIAGRFPTHNRKDMIEVPDEVLKEQLPKGDNTAEERRLFYVGITRAKDYLVLSYALDYGGVRKRKTSGFVTETGWKTQTYESDSQLSLLSVKPKDAPVIKMGQEFVFKVTSYSQIDTYKACPLKFKYRYILQIPAEPHHALSFGRSIHETLNEFHQFERVGKDLEVQTLLELYDKHFVEEGYESEEHKAERKLAGGAALAKYHSHYKELFGVPEMLEQAFNLNIAGVKLIGKIDRIDKLSDGTVEIVDYKTGSLQKKKEVDRDEQLSIYALAAREALGLSVSKLSLYFIEGNEKVETVRTDAQIDKKRELLATDIEEIKKSDFPARPGQPFPCGFCEYRRVCPFTEKS